MTLLHHSGNDCNAASHATRVVPNRSISKSVVVVLKIVYGPANPLAIYQP